MCKYSAKDGIFPQPVQVASRPSGAERADQSFQAAFREPIPCLPRDSIEVGVS